LEFPSIFLQQMKLASSNLARSWCLPEPITKSHPEEKARGPGLRNHPKYLPFNISAMAKASEFKFGTQLGFAKAHHKITRRRDSAHGPELGQLAKMWAFLFNISAMVAASNFKFCT